MPAQAALSRTGRGGGNSIRGWLTAMETVMEDAGLSAAATMGGTAGTGLPGWTVLRSPCFLQESPSSACQVTNKNVNHRLRPPAPGSTKPGGNEGFCATRGAWPGAVPGPLAPRRLCPRSSWGHRASGSHLLGAKQESLFGWALPSVLGHKGPLRVPAGTLSTPLTPRASF